MPYLRGKKTATQQQLEEREYMRQTAFHTTMWRRSTLRTGLEIPCSPWWGPWWGWLLPCSPCKSLVKQVSTCSPCKTSMGACGCALKEATACGRAQARAGSCRNCKLWRWVRTGAGLMAKPVTLGGEPNWNNVFLKDWSSWNRLMMEQLWKNCSLWEGFTLDRLVEDCPMHGTSCWSRRRVWGRRSDRESTQWTDCSFHSPSLWAAQWKEAYESGTKLNLGMMEGGVKIFYIFTYFSLCYSDLIGNKIN